MAPAVTALRYRREARVLEVEFADGARFDLPAELLRVESPSAEVQGHGPGQKVIVAGRREVGILRIEPVGHYAVRIAFDDLHDSGIYTWAWLRRLGEEQAQAWADYEAALALKGLSRDPRKSR
ncbi:gamma-butyrobetaine hydroxylase-like domain-containing protein [Roseococcus sp. DSY-14]|uniref:gamma-butyrobetaine hydroxylase-like domain-containing protein n=1 Tax=Roseococcus sp. DSY-14 TaxID=3369650 RepID=UPI00387A8957